jgi:anaerobic selenocysteine-containing dehydrogenase
MLRLITTRSNDQFNTTVYGFDDRFRGVKGTRKVVFMNQNDMDKFGLQEAEIVDLACDAGDGVAREVHGFRVTPYAIAQGCCAGYFPECNPLIPIWHHDERAMTPAYKSVPVQIRKQAAG